MSKSTKKSIDKNLINKTDKEELKIKKTYSKKKKLKKIL
tara:strand:+ start:509 stop:625 length:117 start_codon:yes stop_codon:yes gene_type:complete